jgi:4-amino-4-deoxy-L-arabinose transferase-like glycosyltransferase
LIRREAYGRWIDRGEELAAALYGLAIALLLVLLAHNHFQLVSAPFPLDYYEGTVPLITGVIASGRNRIPCAAAGFAYGYPPLYHIIVAPLAAIFGNSVRLHRLVSGFFVLLSCLLLWRAARRAAPARRTARRGGPAVCRAAVLFHAGGQHQQHGGCSSWRAC